ncbi:MAG: metallophosphatase family protein [bacterium]|nr:metallophosphatase family protein [bacterium]MCM1374382.1 metallophosphatase family protein [Muribaculum sp.]
MRVAVVSDIHGNYKALEVFLEYIERLSVDAIIGLGDYLTDSPYPQRTLSLIYEMQKKYPCHLIRGNREEYLLENRRRDQGWHICSSNGALYYTYQQIRESDLDWMEALPSEIVLQLGDCPELTLCHGAPGVIRGNFQFDRPLMEQSMKRLQTRYLLGGHSHHQCLEQLYGKIYLNPGSLGMPIDEQGRHTQFAIMEGSTQNWEIELVTMDYDVDGFLRDFRESGIEDYGLYLTRAAEKTLLTGHNYFYYSVCEACKISQNPLSETSEEVWRQVAEVLKL